MKALILHGTDNDHTGNWFPWLKAELEKLNFEVWVPDLPNSKRPNIQLWTEYLLGQGWNFNDSLVIGHSAGAVEILGLLEALPDGVKVDTAIMVAVFRNGLGWEALQDLEGLSFNFESIKAKAEQLIIIHSDDDPHCPIAGAEEIAKGLDAEFIHFSDKKHFSLGTNPEMSKFPELLDIIKQKVLDAD